MQYQDQKYSINPILTTITQIQNVFLLMTFINFLDNTHINILVTAGLKQKRQEKFYKILIAKKFMAQYLNKVDRSLYYLFYDHPNFITIEQETTTALANQLYSYLHEAFFSFQTIMKLISSQLIQIQSSKELLQLISAIYFNPDLPLPKMKRQTIAMYATTPCQHYLALCKTSEDQYDQIQMEECLIILKNKIQQELTQKIGKIWTSQQIQKISAIYFRGFIINSQKIMQDYLCPGLLTHNIVVLLIGLCHKMTEVYLTWINNIEDPMMRFTEFLLRSTLFRSIVLSLEDKFLFLKNCYSQIYISIYNPPPLIPKFSFYRTALSIWLQKSINLHQKNEKIYLYMISKLRQKNILEFIRKKCQKLPSFYGELKDCLQLQEFSQQLKSEAYLNNNGKIELEGFFQQNLEMYQIIVKDYSDYLVDISTNQFNVHWCGHSLHSIQKKNHYHHFSQLIMNQTLEFFKFLTIKMNSLPNQLRASVFKEILCEDIRFLLDKIASTSTIRYIIEELNEYIKKEIQYFGLSIWRDIEWDFSEKDELIAYFAAKANISQDCPQEVSFYYDLQLESNNLPKTWTNEQESAQSEQSEAQIYLSQEQI